jgi:hypothetical protein
MNTMWGGGVVAFTRALPLGVRRGGGRRERRARPWAGTGVSRAASMTRNPTCPSSTMRRLCHRSLRACFCGPRAPRVLPFALVPLGESGGEVTGSLSPWERVGERTIAPSPSGRGWGEGQWFGCGSGILPRPAGAGGPERSNLEGTLGSWSRGGACPRPPPVLLSFRGPKGRRNPVGPSGTAWPSLPFGGQPGEPARPTSSPGYSSGPAGIG